MPAGTKKRRTAATSATSANGKAEEARRAAIERGDLILTRQNEFTATDKAPASALIVRKVIDAYQKSDKPLVFNDVALKAGSKFPEDLIVAMYSLEALGKVKRYDAKTTSPGATVRRPKVAFMWVGD